MPPASMLRATRATCSGWRAVPSAAATCLLNASSEILSPEAASSSKRASTVMPLFCTSSLMAVEMSADLATEMVWQAFLAFSTVALHSLSFISPFICILFRSRWASKRGPFTTFPSFSSSSLRHVLASSTHLAVPARSLSSSSSVDAGLANASSSAAVRPVSGLAASSSFCALASIGSTFAFATSITASACFFSFATTCAFFSSASFFRNAVLAAASFFFRASKSTRALETLGRSFVSSARASAIGPGPEASSLDFVVRKLSALPITLPASTRALSMSAEHVLKGVTSSRYVVPSFPLMVTKPAVSLDSTLHSMRVMPPSSVLVLARPVASRTSPISILEVVLLLEISNTSVTAICLTQVNLLLNMSFQFSRLTAPDFDASRCRKTALRRSSSKLTSSRPIFSGRAASHAENASSEVPPICWKRPSSVRSFSAACSRRTDASVVALLATRKSRPASSSRGAQTSVAFFSSSSKAEITWPAWNSTLFTTNLLS
mmetsp:Transcript_94780/g.246868  ORF Transcript_94780/g.246868 Transcript_94780/m.246868 type:complete len:492 (-) Transcript_94780:349-1824(-)